MGVGVGRYGLDAKGWLRVTKTLLGRLIAYEAPYYLVECPDAPKHLQTMHLTGWQTGGACVGDQVYLIYRAFGAGYCWQVSEVVKK